MTTGPGKRGARLFDEFFAAKVVAGDAALALELLLDNGLRGDAGVVRACRQERFA